MLFFSKSSKENDINKKPSIMRQALSFAFKPQIGAGLRPLRETTDIFIQLLATVFIGQKMFPADHPAYLGTNNQHLSLGLVLGTVWQNLKISRQTAPQVLLFALVVLGIGFAALMFFVLMASLLNLLLVNKAHAAGYFDAPYPDTDIAQNWLGFLFNSGTFSWFGLFTNDPLYGASGIVNALMTALAFYSDAILIVAAVILFYHLASMVVETAHHGVVMGKRANQIWAPIRLVVAIGLLVPISGGLNSGQYIVIKIASWGSGLGSNVWNIFLNKFANNVGVGGVPQYARDVVYNTLLTEACSQAYDGFDKKIKKVDSGSENPMHEDAAVWMLKESKYAAQQGLTTYRAEHQNHQVENSQKCGHYGFNKTNTGTSSTARAVKGNADFCYTQLKQNVDQYLQTELLHFLPPDAGGKKGTEAMPKYDGGVENLVTDYEACLAELPIPDLSIVFAASRAWGWLSAGATLSAITQAESDANDVSALIPDTQSPDLSGGDPVMRDDVAPVVRQFAAFVKTLPQNDTSSSSGSFGTDACAAQRPMLMEEAKAMEQQGNAKDHFLDRVLQLIDWLAAWNCVWNSSGTLADGSAGFVTGIQFSGANPLAEMAMLGQHMIDTAYDTVDMLVNMMLSGGANLAEIKSQAGELKGAGSVAGEINKGLEGDNKGTLLTAIAGILTTIAGVFFVSGVLLAYYIPLLPFIEFLFNVLTWVITVLESVIAIPLVALAHLNPEGEGLPGNLGKASYHFVFSVFLRPVLMVFGLIVGLLVFYASVSYMNLLYAFAVSTSGGLATGHLLLSRLIYSALYVIILYMCANSAFKCINWIPEHAVRWMGGTPLHLHKMGDAQQVAGPLQQGAGNFGQIAGSMGQIGQAVGGLKTVGSLESGGTAGARAQIAGLTASSTQSSAPSTGSGGTVTPSQDRPKTTKDDTGMSDNNPGGLGRH